MMVGEAGIEPASPFGERILSPSCMPDKDMENIDLRADISKGTLEGTPKAHQNAHTDSIRAVLRGMSKDEIIGLLADALADGGEGVQP